MAPRSAPCPMKRVHEALPLLLPCHSTGCRKRASAGGPAWRRLALRRRDAGAREPGSRILARDEARSARSRGSRSSSASAVSTQRGSSTVDPTDRELTGPVQNRGPVSKPVTGTLPRPSPMRKP